MEKKQHIEKLVQDTLSSADNIQHVEPKPFLFTRVKARMDITAGSSFLQRSWMPAPTLAFATVICIILLNILVMAFRNNNSNMILPENTSAITDEYSYTMKPIYDIENMKP